MFKVLGAVALLSVVTSAAFAQNTVYTDAQINAAREEFVAGNYTVALATLIPAADVGNMRAQNLVGAAAQNGFGMDADAEKAVRYMTMAADQGYPPSFYNLAYLYQVGMVGLPADLAKTRAFYLRATALDYGPAMSLVGGMMFNGEGGDVDQTTALRYFRRGVELGDAGSFEWLAWMNATGQNMPVNLEQARAYYEIAGLLGEVDSKNEFARMLEEGEGGPQDLLRAMSVYQEVIADDYAYAGINAAWLTLEAPDLFQDQIRGLAYCLWAVENADPADVAEFETSCSDMAEGFSDIDRRVAQKAADAL